MAEQTVIRKTLKETGEPALHRSVSQQLAAHPLLQASSAALHNASLLQVLITVVTSSFLLQVLIHLSLPDGQVLCVLLSAFSLSFAQSSSVPVQS